MEGSIRVAASLSHFSVSGCSEAFSSLMGVDEARCELENFNEENNSGSYLVRFISWSLIPYENNWYQHYGDPPLDYFSCDISPDQKGKGVRCEVSEVAPVGSIPGQLVMKLYMINITF